MLLCGRKRLRTKKNSLGGSIPKVQLMVNVRFTGGRLNMSQNREVMAQWREQ